LGCFYCRKAGKAARFIRKPGWVIFQIILLPGSREGGKIFKKDGRDYFSNNFYCRKAGKAARFLRKTGKVIFQIIFIAGKPGRR
jgi:hypothetical protein